MHGANAICPYCKEYHKGKPKYYAHDDFNTHLLAYHTENQVLQYVENLNKTLSALQMAQAEAAEIAGTRAAERNAIRAAAESSKREAAAAKANKNEAKKIAASLLDLTETAWREYDAASTLVNLRTNQAAHALMSMRGHHPSRSRSQSRSPRRNYTNNKGGYRRKTRRTKK